MAYRVAGMTQHGSAISGIEISMAASAAASTYVVRRDGAYSGSSEAWHHQQQRW